MYFCPNFEPIHCSMSCSNYCSLTCLQVSQEEDQVVWYSHLFKNFPQFVVIHVVKGFSIVNEAEIDVFLEFPCFFYDPMVVGNLISGFSALSKSSLYLWKFLVHLLLKSSLKDFEHYLASMWNVHNCTIGRNHLDPVYLSESRKINEILGRKFRKLRNIKLEKEVTWEKIDSIGNILS